MRDDTVGGAALVRDTGVAGLVFAVFVEGVERSVEATGM